jgi:hypothetical protein
MIILGAGICNNIFAPKLLNKEENRISPIPIKV